jgi:hypothetical protein
VGSPSLVFGFDWGDYFIEVERVALMAAATDNITTATKVMKQKAVYWAPSGVDEFGKPEYDTPEEIDCRWEDKQEEFITPNGEREISHAKLIVDRDLLKKGVMWLGELDDVTDEDNPKNNDGAWEIRAFMKTPNFKGTAFLREVYL